MNTQNKIKNLSLHWASLCGDLSTVRDIIQAGADVDERDDDGSSPLHLAVAESDNFAVTKALLEARANVNARNKEGYAPLHFAAANNDNLAVTKTLLELKASVKARDIKGYTPLHFAAANNTNPAIVEALLNAGARASATTNSERTALDLIRDNEALKDTQVRWTLHDLSYKD